MITSKRTATCRLPLAPASIFCVTLIPIRKEMLFASATFRRGATEIHNANTLGASLLARTYSYTRNESYRSLAQKAIQYTANHQRANGVLVLRRSC